MPLTSTRPTRELPPSEEGLRLHGRGPVRRPLAAIASLLLVVVSVATFVSLYSHAGSRVSVLAVAHDVALGQIIEAKDIATAKISASSGLATIPARDIADAVGHRAGVALKKGTLLAFGELGPVPLPAGRAVVGVATKAGELPAEGVSPGESVEVIVTDPAGAGQAADALGAGDGGGSTAAATPSGSDGPPTALGSVVIPDATVTAVADDSSGGDAVVVSVVVAQGVAPIVASASAAGQAAIVVVGTGS